jgi:hypothetical protein
MDLISRNYDWGVSQYITLVSVRPKIADSVLAALKPFIVNPD